MALTIPNRPFGLRECDFAVWDGDSYGTAIKFDAAQEFTINIEADEAVLNGNDVQLESIPFNRRATVSATFGGSSMEAKAAVTGATLGTTGSTPNQIKKLDVKGTDIPPYGKLRGRMVNSSSLGGDNLYELPYVRFYTGPQGTSGNGAYMTEQFSGTALPHPDTSIIISQSQRETAAVLS